VLWYVLAVAAVVASYCIFGALVYALVALSGALPLAGAGPLEWRGLFGTYIAALLRVPGQVILAIAGAVGGVILAVSALRAWQLGEGGPAIAHLLGARYVDPGKCTPAERRLLNVVDEMSIASGISVPPVYVLEREDAVNALVAGYSPNEAAIVVTRGALQKLSRDELQGVMGHEYSHILNGDMALNMRLACILAGLSWLAERGEQMVLSAAAANRGLAREEAGAGAPAAILGAILAFVGFPGVFAADAIKAAISRERELLADSASVQYTRNPDGIAGALDSILAQHAYTQVLAAHAGELSHMFFAPVVERWWGFPTHPPIEERIGRAHPRFQRDAYREARHGARREVAVLDGLGQVVKYAPIGATAAAALLGESVGRPTAQHVDYAAQLLAGLPERLREALHRAEEAECAMFALALGPDASGRREALGVLEARRGAEIAARTSELHVHVVGLARNHMLTLAELAVPAIKAQTQKERDRFIADLAAVVEADRRVTLTEFVLHSLLRQRLREGAGQPIPTRFRTLAEVADDAHLVLSLVAFAAGEDAKGAYEKGAAVLGCGARPWLGPEALDTARIRNALERLRQLAPFVKPTLLKACLEAAAADGVFRLAEAELVRMVAATLDCPVPPMLQAQDPQALAA
jgi:Zn-dependent protease with chaperone function